MNSLKKLRLITILLLIFSCNLATGQSLEEVLERYYKASGIENLEKVKTIQFTGTMKNYFLEKISKNIPDYLFSPDFDITIARKGGYLFQIFDRKESTIYGYFSGEYWKDQESFPPKKWEPNNFDRLQIQLYLDFEGFLFRWKEKGFRLEKLENNQLESQYYYRVKVTTPENDVLYYYINPENYLVEKISFFGDLAESEKYASITFSDFKEIRGVQIAFNRIYNVKILDDSFGKREVIFKKIEFNVEVDSEIFQLKSRLYN